MPGRLGAGAHRDTHAGAGGECLRHLTPSPRSEKFSKFIRKTAGTPPREKNSPRKKRRRDGQSAGAPLWIMRSGAGIGHGLRAQKESGAIC